MITIYQHDKDGFATGTTREQAEKQPIPPGWTHKAPKGVAGERYVGNTWQVVPLPPPTVPSSVTKRQAKEALIRQGKYQQALDALEAIADPTEKLISQNYWQESQVFKRDNPVLNSLAETGLGMTQAELDDLFIYAATL